MPISLPIYSDSYRPSSDWVKTVSEKEKALKAFLPLESALENKIRKHLLVKQLTNNLLLSNINIDKEKVASLIENTELLEDPLEILVQNFAKAINYLNTLVDKHESTDIFLTSNLLKELHALIFSGLDKQGGFYRETPGKPIAPNHQPVDSDVLPILVDNALEWFNADSFRELHPLEQAWLVHLRIIDLQPFEKGNRRLARLVASLYAQKAKLFPIIVNSTEQEFYSYAVNNSLMMITQPGVELFARSIIQTYDEVFSIVNTL
ncbi:MAG: Fic family protein [Acidobacteria bacterium]|nr:Fic family protein [Acidobacteriota bacterium]